MDWQPIETAPRDGTEFQAWIVWKGGRGSWEPKARFNEDEAFQYWTRVDYDEDGWDFIRGYGVATHWMPLPLPPTGESE